MTEVLTRTASLDEERDPVQVEHLEQDESLTPASRALRKISGWLDRKAQGLDRRTVNKAHGQALEDNYAFDKANQEEAFATYEPNIQATADRENEESIDDAISSWKSRNSELYATRQEKWAQESEETARKLQQKQERDTEREARNEAIKAKLRQTGRAAIDAVITPLAVGVGGSILAVRGLGELGKSAGRKIESAAVTTSDWIESTGDRLDGFTERTTEKTRSLLKSMKEKAEIRRTKRRNWISSRIDSIKSFGSGVAETGREAYRFTINGINQGREAVDATAEKARNTIGIARSVGEAAIRAGRADLRAHREQNRVDGA